MKPSKKPASSSKAKKNVTLPKEHRDDVSRGATKSLKGNKGDSSVASLPQNDKPRSETRVEIKPAKGRPMLTWVGKKPLRHAIAYPAQLIESFSAGVKEKKIETWADWPKDIPQTGLLFHGDNKDVLAHLLANGFRGKVKMVYIDPPFDSGADYVRKVSLREGTIKAALDGEGHSLGEQVQYSDIWANDNYLQFMYERLMLLKELLTDDGSIYLHCDSRRGHFLQCLMDEIFGADNFRNEIIWKRSDAHGNVGQGTKHYGPVHDIILFYSKSSEITWNLQYTPLNEGYVKEFYRYKEPDGRVYKLDNLLGPGGAAKGNPVYEFLGVVRPWRFSKEKIEKMYKDGKIVQTKPGTVPMMKRYLDDSKGVPLQSIWTDISMIRGWSGEKADYPTQKPEELLERILSVSSDPNDIILDCYLGSGTTAAVAQQLGRRWIGADINKGAIQTTTKRLQVVIQDQGKNAKGKTQALPGMEAEDTPTPVQLAFSVYRVNDYDLQIQHNEAFNLAVEHLGMTRTKTDAFFDGTLGKKLVKIVPFNHPVTPLDLEEVKKELNHRPDEERDIVAVGMGKEYAVEAWLDEWNKLRKQGNIPNRIDVIELRSDPKYGGFFIHEPAKAKVSFKRVKDNVEITIDDFISPTILERLKQQNKDNPLFQPQVSDWRSMVDSVMIDSNYDGNVFNITLADVPERKNDLVDGKYVVEAKKGATVAVKVTDMLGEEVLVVKGE